jgi:cyclopropane-fatty-acyl-phospholipid synthase
MRPSLVAAGIALAERGAPDAAIRWGMRKGIEGRLAEEMARPEVERDAWLAEWHRGPIALVPDRANDQHYEVPAAFFQAVLGPRLKYSSCLWKGGVTDLARAEEAMLEETCRGAGIEDGMTVLDLGCGWGSLSLWIAERYPGCTVTAVSNSSSQGRYISEGASSARLGNVSHTVCDVNSLEIDGRFDRVVSVEMFEHVRNHPALLATLDQLVEPGGAVFLHVFAHRLHFWPFEDRGAGDWMARTFFSGGIMPSHDLFARFPSPFQVTSSTWHSGRHYQHTLDAWLDRIDAAPEAVAATLEGSPQTIQQWRMFMMACSELFGYADGAEWGVSHLLMTRRLRPTSARPLA